LEELHERQILAADPEDTQIRNLYSSLVERSAATTAEREWSYAAPEPILRVPGTEQSAVAARGDRRAHVFV